MRAWQMYEVSQAVWNYSYWHAHAAIGGILLTFVETASLVTSGGVLH